MLMVDLFEEQKLFVSNNVGIAAGIIVDVRFQIALIFPILQIGSLAAVKHPQLGRRFFKESATQKRQGSLGL